MEVILDKAQCERAYKRYLELLARIAVASDLTPYDFIISGLGFCNAMVEAKRDIELLNYRRNFKDGISRGKLAGIIVDRLCKNPVAFPAPARKENADALKIPILTALAFGLFLIRTNPAALDPALIRELNYYVTRQNIDQEALGLCFDAIFMMG